jgi:hypothetical protein
MTRQEAQTRVADIVRPINQGIIAPAAPAYTFGEYVTQKYIPHKRGGEWKPDREANRSGFRRQVRQEHH